MSPSCPAPGTFNPDQEIAVHDLGCIESVLDQMWRSGEQSAQDSGGGRAPVVRACLGNLIVITPEADDRTVSEILDTLSIRWPARMILVRIDPANSTTNVVAAVRAVCHLPQPGSPQVCCEHIDLLLGPAGVSLLPGIIGPLTEPDLPVFLWWAHPLVGWEPLLRKLIPLAGALIIDQARPDGPHALREWLAYGAGTGLLDLAWERVEPWRRALASVYDDPLLRPSLTQLIGVRISTGSDASVSAEATLLLGWFAAQLGWKVDRPLHGSAGERSAFALSAGREILLSVLHGESSCPDTSIAGIALESADGSEVALTLDPSGCRLMVTACDSVSCRLRRALPLRPADPARLLGSAILSSPAAMAVYARAARVALELASGIAA